jgi:hypothetical protein
VKRPQYVFVSSLGAKPLLRRGIRALQHAFESLLGK